MLRPHDDPHRLHRSDLLTGADDPPRSPSQGRPANGQLQRNRGRNVAPRDTGTPELKSLRDWYGGDGD